MRKHIKPQRPKGGTRIKEPDAQVSSERQRPVFCLQYLDHEYGLSKCQKEEKAAFADTLHQLSQRDWMDLKFASKHGSGCEKIHRDSIKGRIPTIATDEVTFLAFRFYGKKPLVGFRAGRILHIIWLDRTHSLYG